jgi:hypothetical protein
MYSLAGCTDVFDKLYKTRFSNHAGAKKEVDVVRYAPIEIGLIMQSVPKANGSGSKWKGPSDRDEKRRKFSEKI